MDQRKFCLFSLSLLVILVFTGCKGSPQALVPVTGDKDIAQAAPAALARDSVLKYLADSSRLAGVPSGRGWQLEAGQQDREYRYRNGDWLLVVLLPDAGNPNQEVLLINLVEPASWTGYITPEGRLVDTAYGR